MLGSLRLPFLFQEFDVDGERISLKILKGLGRFEGSGDIPEEALSDVVMNQELRDRLTNEKEDEVEIELIRDALVEEIKLREERLHDALKQHEEHIVDLDADNQNKDKKINELKAQVEKEKTNSKNQSDTLAAKLKATELKHARLAYLVGFIVVASISFVAGWLVDRYCQWCIGTIGYLSAGFLVGSLVFIACHLLLERMMRGNGAVSSLWPFKMIKRFRGWVWSVLIVGLIMGVVTGLVVNNIQKKIDHADEATSTIESSTNQNLATKGNKE